MRTITITVPKTNTDKWKVGFNGASGKMMSANTVLNRIRRRLSASKLRENTRIVVKEHTDSGLETVNESLTSKDAKYLVWITTCFLEDYIAKRVVSKIERQTTTYSGLISQAC